MKKKNQMVRMVIVIMGLILSQEAFTQNIQFRYDESGNRDQRFVASARVDNEQPTAATTEEVVEEDKLYPNPTAGILQFSLVREEPAVSQVSLFDLNGRLLYRKSFTAQDFEINIAHRPEGIYILKWIFADQSRSLKIIKQ